MTTYDAFEVSPVPTPVPGEETQPPELFRGIYAMPMFVTIPTPDLTASVDFWTRAFGFFDLFSVPGHITHLRRWAFQDVLLVPGEAPAARPPMTVTFACVLGQLPQIATSATALSPESVTGPHDTPWNTTDVEVVTPENVRVILTAAKAFDPDGPEARNLEEIGITGPRKGNPLEESPHE